MSAEDKAEGLNGNAESTADVSQNALHYPGFGIIHGKGAPDGFSVYGALQVVNWVFFPFGIDQLSIHCLELTPEVIAEASDEFLKRGELDERIGHLRRRLAYLPCELSPGWELHQGSGSAVDPKAAQRSRIYPNNLLVPV